MLAGTCYHTERSWGQDRRRLWLVSFGCSYAWIAKRRVCTCRGIAVFPSRHDCRERCDAEELPHRPHESRQQRGNVRRGEGRLGAGLDCWKAIVRVARAARKGWAEGGPMAQDQGDHSDMNWERDIQLLTPCFCRGAYRDQPEIRAPSIRGMVRWWFRALGGTPDQEKALFGGVHAGAVASRLVFRV